TNGTVAPDPSLTELVARYNVSPKLAHSGVPAVKRIRADALMALQTGGRAIFKFVVRDTSDLDEIAGLEALHGLGPIWVMPGGQTGDQVQAVMRLVADDVLARGWNLTTRLHVLLWDAARGR